VSGCLEVGGLGLREREKGKREKERKEEGLERTLSSISLTCSSIWACMLARGGSRGRPRCMLIWSEAVSSLAFRALTATREGIWASRLK